MQTTKQLNYGVLNTVNKKHVSKIGYNVKRRRAQRNKLLALSFCAIIAIASVLSITVKATQTKEETFNIKNTMYVEQYGVAPELMYYIEKYCDEYNTNVDLVMSIAYKKSGLKMNKNSGYGKGLLEMRPSTIEWVTEQTGTYVGELSKPQVAAKTTVFFVDYQVGNYGVESAIERICGNETDTVSEVSDIYLEFTGTQLFR